MGFRLIEANIRGRHIRTSMPEKSSKEVPGNFYTVLIGRNGTGKSRLLADICYAFSTVENAEEWGPNFMQLMFENEEVSITFMVNGRINEIELINKNLFRIISDKSILTSKDLSCLPEKVIATTISPFDKFPIGERRFWKNSEDEKGRIYRYLGSRNNTGQISGTGQISRVIESLMFASEKDERELSELRHVFKFLGYFPRMTVDYRMNFPSKAFGLIEDIYINGGEISEEDLVQIFRQKSRRTSLGSEFSKNPTGFLKKLYLSLRMLLEEANHRTSNKRVITIDLDFENARFYRGSLDIFRTVLFLRKLGLLSLENLRFIKINANESVNIRDASSGEQGLVLTFLGIASEIEDNSLIIIDEPEISLHPEWQERFIDLLTSIFSGYKGCHFLLATHSPLILSKLDKENCAVVTMEDGQITSAAEFSRRSVDYQLAEAFKNPGFHNEYLARQGLSALRMASQREFDSNEFRDKLDLLRRARPKLEDDDPVAEIIDALIQMQDEVSQ